MASNTSVANQLPNKIEACSILLEAITPLVLSKMLASKHNKHWFLDNLNNNDLNRVCDTFDIDISQAENKMIKNNLLTNYLQKCFKQ